MEAREGRGILMVKPKHGEYQCLHCEAHVEGRFTITDTVFCYLCGNQMLVKDMIKIEKPKEVQVKPVNNSTGTFITYDYGPGGKLVILLSTVYPIEAKEYDNRHLWFLRFQYNYKQ